MRRTTAVLAVTTLLAASMIWATPAQGEPPIGADCNRSVCTAKAPGGQDKPPAKSRGGGASDRGLTGSLKKTAPVKGKDPKVKTFNKQVSAWERWRDSADRKLAEYNAAMDAWSECSSTAGADRGDTPSVPCDRPAAFDPGKEPDVDGGVEVKGGNEASPPRLTPAQAAQIASAQLRIPTAKVGIGPDPSANEWDMLAVGFPVWLYADGDTSIGPVTDSVGGVSVSLEASIASTSYNMGDGTTVECNGPGTRYTSTVEPGTPSPTCGHIYEQPSLPDGSYTVTSTTTWAVTWTAGGQSGVINVPSVGSTDLPIGELQAIVTN